jgi:hypothetical protein
MKHRTSPADNAFRRQFESGNLPSEEFDHRGHIRAAYAYLTGNGTDAAYRQMRTGLLNYLDAHGVDLSKYHDTMTRAWILAVRHFMEKTPDCDSAETFIERNPVMLDPKIMLTHYSADLLFSEEARASFIEPDLDPIPDHGI